MGEVVIRAIEEADVPGVRALWEAVFPDARAWNQPAAYLARKRARRDDLILAAVRGRRVVGAVALGYDGIRGWVYHLAVAPAARRRGIATALMGAAEAALRARGCPKINLQIVAGNDAVVAFYARLGYAVEPRISMGKAI
ncbi:GNAT family acetyltransferase [bacterium]|nr:GNAT family acetyltransferase [bacterium]